MKTAKVSGKNLEKNWLIVDAADAVVGRLATEIASKLRGKHKANFVPHLDCGDNIVVINASKVRFTGSKWKNKFYYHHTGYIGSIKSERADDALANHPEKIIEKAVWGMLPHNALGRKVLGNLRVYPGSEHPHQAQKLTQMPVRTQGRT